MEGTPVIPLYGFQWEKEKQGSVEHTGTMFAEDWIVPKDLKLNKANLFNLELLFSRTTHISQETNQPSGFGGRSCRIQMPGTRRSSANSALEER